MYLIQLSTTSGIGWPESFFDAKYKEREISYNKLQQWTVYCMHIIMLAHINYQLCDRDV